MSVERIRLGVSSCLLGERVRWDGQHKRDRWVADVLAAHFEIVAICPEQELGLGVPREPIHLIPAAGRAKGLRLVGVRSGVDHTDDMQAFAQRRIAALSALDLGGYVFKKDSPSCGVFRVRVHGGGRPTRDGMGMFARAFHEALPLVPIEEEGRLNDARLRESFLVRVFTLQRLRALGPRPGRGALVEFHARHKMLLHAHHQAGARVLGRLVADAKAHRPAELFGRYAQAVMDVLARPATTKSHRNVLEHMLGHLRDHLDAGDRHELRDAIFEYARGLLPRAVPLTLLRHHVRRHEIATLVGQVYLEPHPRELLLQGEP